MKKLLLLTSMFGLFVFAGCSSPLPSSLSTGDVVVDTTVTEQSPTIASTGYTVQDVETHSTPDSCRSIVRSQVYDFTTRAGLHPGGSGKILDICGKDATPVFEKVHGGKEKPEMKLEDFYIGDIILNRQ